jgi:cytochrome b subunit of formate dehydrogenase
MPGRSIFGAVVGLLLLAAAAAGAPQGNADCLACHGDRAAVRARGGSVHVDGAVFGQSVHGASGVACVDCHTDLAKTTDFPHREHLKPVACAACHDAVGQAHPFHPGIGRASKGEGKPETPCASCHGNHDVAAVKDAAFRFAPPKDSAACATCHREVAQHFAASEHGKALARREPSAPTCLACHHNAVTAGSGLGLAELKRAQERLCLSCHLKNRAVRDRAASTASFISAYESSVHGAALLAGNSRAPTCIDCHGAHDPRHGFDSSALVNKMRIPQLCARCHETESRLYRAGVHGMALQKGNKDAPACTDCHGEHNILSPKDPRSPVAARNVSARVCTPCHASVKLTEKWNLPRDRAQTFSDSYHGLAARGGSLEVANCASCHGAHDILPSSNPASSTHPANLARTCGAAGCHPGANRRFGWGKVHVVGSSRVEPILYWIATIYVVAIVVVIGGMLFHNALDFLRKARRRLKIRRGEIAEPPAGRALYLRMTVNERIQHAALALSFIVLVVTGFMLRYPETSWVVLVRRLSLRSFEYRSLLHRIAAAVLIGASLFHLGYVTLTARGRRLVADLWWRRRDIADVVGLIKHNAGLSPEPPRFERFSYIEKSEYWALVWGTAVMAATGLVMWFDNMFISIFSKLGYDVSRTIHFYEAWLASLAILVWHFYWVIFNPEAYPMNMSWITGRLSEREMEEEHPAELDRILAQVEKPPEPPA